MLTLCSKDRIRHYRGIENDITTGKCYEIPRNNGDEIYLMDKLYAYMFDEENQTWLPQKRGVI